MMLGLQASGAAPIYYNRLIPDPDTAASAIRIGDPAGWSTATTAIADSRGAVDIVSDEEIFAAQRWLASKEGVFAEPASAASVAGLLKCCTDFSYARSLLAKVPDEGVIVCTLTGHGLKDVACVLNERTQPVHVSPTKAAILSILEGIT
jgi:threonine synthase